ncbi:PorT family protein [Rhodocytophaga rosea]|uniref:PorT family protein n=1 Tax=Rhodocytophaga rosea TaxID=2704465 RepID=A0A6C0GBM5_9BACT|nr:porin family protein [Rhodocytophaga rosea]QHT65288.1 PorT family protein [Rhodocytophaga rosea]
MKPAKKSIINTWVTGSLFTACLLTAAFSANAQDDRQFRFGVKGGVNVSNLYIDEVNDEKSKVGLHAGVWMKAPIGEFFAIQPELLWSSKGTKIGTYQNIPFAQDGQVRFNLNYVDLPVLASLTLGPISIQAGPYVSYLFNANVKNLKQDLTTDSVLELDRSDFNAVDYGLAGGLALDIKGFQIGLRYNYGLREIGKSDIAGQITRNAKNSVAQAFIGIGF